METTQQTLGPMNKTLLGIVNPDTTYHLVFIGDAPNMDGTRDFVFQLNGTELKKLVERLSEWI